MIKNIDVLCKQFESIRQESFSCYAQLERLEKNFIPKKEEFRISIADLKNRIFRLREQMDEIERQIQ